MSALGRGLSAAGYSAGEMFAKSALMDAQSEQDLQKAMRLAEFRETLDARGDERKMRLADEARQAQTSRIDAKAGAIADEAVAPKRGLIDANIADRSTWTAEQQAAVDQALALDKSAAVADPKVRTQAAIQTGDISPKDAATLTQKDDAAIYKAMWEQSKEEGRNSRSDARIAASAEASDKRLGYLMASLEQRGEKKTKAETNKEALQFLRESRMQVTNEETTLRQMYQAQIKDKSRSEVAKLDAEYGPKFADVSRKRAEIDADFNSLREKVGLPAKAEPKAEPKPEAKPQAAPKAPVSSLPAGAKKIGTSGGKAVYETPDGKRFVEN
jgi:hypothetical protein